jgi:dipeptidyl aminopeptidase/acylaminoacyl peptidase
MTRGKKQPALLTPHQGEVNYWPTAFSKDGKTLFYTSDEGAEFTALYSMDLKTKKPTPVLKAEWDVEDGRFSEGYGYFITETNADGKPLVVVTDQAKKTAVALPDPGVAQAVLVPRVFSRNDRYAAASLVTDTAPQTLYVVDFKENTATKLIEALPESLRNRPMIASSSVRIPSFDGKEVPAMLYRPAGNGPFPAIIQVHGGPTYQARVRFDRMVQYLVAKGYLVLVPNVRGSTGYGKTFTKLDNLDLGGGPLQDVVACKRWLIAQAKAFPDRVVVMGGSYGGYMALAAATFTPTEFGALVDYHGPSDLKSLVESFPPYFASISTYIYRKFGDPNNPEHAQYQHDRSPLYFADKIQKPLLVVQGANDARVKQDQSDRIVAELKKRNVPVHYLILPGEGHGFSQNESMLAAYQATDRFLDRYVWGDTSVTVLPSQ